MIQHTTGDLFESDAEALVNAVNCVGVMGKGIALEFRRRFPRMFEAYRRRCEAGRLRPGRVWAVRDGGRVIVSFPTKDHWRDGSRIQDVEAGLRSLRELLVNEGISSVALPALGCGLGGLDWDVVAAAIHRELDGLPGVRIELYEPRGAREPLTER
jgi:O-acetyl-ADP-ribose deacetylase (regulator of RNase III)